MDGADVDVGRHSSRTLASFSMTGKVCIVYSLLSPSKVQLILYPDRYALSLELLED